MRCRLLALMLVVTACGGPGVDVAASSSTARTEIAPPFSLALGAGGTFTLMDEKRPVYLLFWAEW